MIPGAGTESDFDGYPYHGGDWRNGSEDTPDAELPQFASDCGSPAGTYPIARFETDLPRIEEADDGGPPLSCDHHTGAGCTNRRRARSIPGTTCARCAASLGGVLVGAHRRRGPAGSPTSGGEPRPPGVRSSGPTTGLTSATTTMRRLIPTSAPNHSRALVVASRDLCRRGGSDGGSRWPGEESPIVKAARSTAAHRTVVVDAGKGAALYHLTANIVGMAGSPAPVSPHMAAEFIAHSPEPTTKLVEGHGVQGHLAILGRPDGRVPGCAARLSAVPGHRQPGRRASAWQRQT